MGTSDTELNSLRDHALASIAAATSLEELEAAKVALLGKKGSVSGLLRSLGSLPEDERKSFAQKVNLLRDEVELTLGVRKEALLQAASGAAIASQAQDVTLPPRARAVGTMHPIQRTIEELVTIFSELGFGWAEGPDVERDWYNFTALNMPENHPARQTQDSFYFAPLKDGTRTLLRTQTSPVQIRTMEAQQPPIRIIAPGRTYRVDYDQTHTPMFHQIEGLLIDESTNFSQLKGILYEFCRRFFGVEELPIRFRPSFFPFTEPSAEVDIGCSRSGSEIKIGAGSSWLEVLGCGMVHPQVLRNCKIDPDKYQGFAFGMGVERLAMLKYGVPDLRGMFDCDVRWLRHYGFSPAVTTAVEVAK